MLAGLENHDAARADCYRFLLHDLLLFGTFLAWAVADRISMKRRQQRPLPGAPASGINDVIAIIGGVALYLAFVFVMHRWLIGVPVIP